MTIREFALEWLQKIYKRKEISLYNATHKPNRSEVEIGNLLETLDVIEYLIEITERNI